MTAWSPHPTEESGRERSESPDSSVGSGAGIDALTGRADPGDRGSGGAREGPMVPVHSGVQASSCRAGGNARTEAGEVGELLRREGLYSSHLATWRRQKRQEASSGPCSGARRGRKPSSPAPLAKRVAELERENKALSARLRQAEVIIDVQKSVRTIRTATPDDSENGS